MQILGILFPLLSLVMLATYIWLVVIAFKRGPGWGVCVLLLGTPAAIVLAVKFWEETKKPFLIHIGSFVGSFALVIVMFGVLGGAALMGVAEQMDQAGAAGVAIPSQDSFDEAPVESAAARRQDNGGSPAAAPVLAAATGEENVRVAAAESRSMATEPRIDVSSGTPPPPRDLVPLNKAHNHVGEVLRIVTIDDRHFNGRLLSDDGNELIFEKVYAAGTIQVTWDKDEIQSLHKVKRRKSE